MTLGDFDLRETVVVLLGLKLEYERKKRKAAEAKAKERKLEVKNLRAELESASVLDVAETCFTEEKVTFRSLFHRVLCLMRGLAGKFWYHLFEQGFGRGD